MAFPGSQRYLEALEKDRKTALARQDAPNYFTLCEELGMTPEDEFLYERGMLEYSLIESRKQEPVVDSGSKYKQFYERAIRLNRDFRFDTEEKLSNLEKHFPGRFGPKGIDPIRKKDSMQIGALHANMLAYSQERIHSQ